MGHLSHVTMFTASLLTDIFAYALYIFLPILALFICYLVITKAFNEMGFSSFEAIIIVFVCFLLGYGILNVGGFRFDNIPLFTYGSWVVAVNAGGAVIPLILSMYLAVKHHFSFLRIIIGIIIVALVTYGVTYPDPEKGIVSPFPFWLLPVLSASIVSIFLMWKHKQKAAPLAYVCGTLGVLIGADVFHLISLLQIELEETKTAIIGGANVFDMVFLTGILAVILDGILIVKEKKLSK